MKDIFDFTNFRLFLEQAFKDQKSIDHSFSHRALCSKLGLRPQSHLLLVLRGKRDLAPDLAVKLAEAIGLHGSEVDYFLWMVLFGQASTAQEKEKDWQEMMTLRGASRTAPITDSQYEYYSHWCLPVLRELIVIPRIQWTPRLLSLAIQPKVPVSLVRQGIQILESLGYIRPKGTGWVKSSPSLATTPTVKSPILFSYHKDLADLAKHSLEHNPGDVRNFSSLTLELNEKEYTRLVQQLTHYRREILGVCGSEGTPDRVYQLNLQLFPMTRSLSTLPRPD